MNIQYPVSEILRCVDYINDPKKEIYESSNEILVLNNPLTMKKEKTKPLVLKEEDLLPKTEKIIKEAESTMLQTPKETKAIKELESSNVQPFQIDEITMVNDLNVDKKEQQKIS